MMRSTLLIENLEFQLRAFGLCEKKSQLGEHFIGICRDLQNEQIGIPTFQSRGGKVKKPSTLLIENLLKKNHPLILNILQLLKKSSHIDAYNSIYVLVIPQNNIYRSFYNVFL